MLPSDPNALFCSIAALLLVGLKLKASPATGADRGGEGVLKPPLLLCWRADDDATPAVPFTELTLMTLTTAVGQDWTREVDVKG